MRRELEGEREDITSLSTPPPPSPLFFPPFHLHCQARGSLVEEKRPDRETRWARLMSRPDMEASQEGRGITVS